VLCPCCDATRYRLEEVKNLAKLLAVNEVRNNIELEDLHAGTSPSMKFLEISADGADGTLAE
jgi:hypothetical protein